MLDLCSLAVISIHKFCFPEKWSEKGQLSLQLCDELCVHGAFCSNVMKVRTFRNALVDMHACSLSALCVNVLLDYSQSCCVPCVWRNLCRAKK